MTVTVLPGEFARDLDHVKLTAEKGPVFLTEHGRATHVVMSIDDYEKLIRPRRSIAEMLSMPADDYFDFEPVPAKDMGFKIPIFDD